MLDFSNYGTFFKSFEYGRFVKSFEGPGIDALKKGIYALKTGLNNLTKVTMPIESGAYLNDLILAIHEADSIRASVAASWKIREGNI